MKSYYGFDYLKGTKQEKNLAFSRNEFKNDLLKESSLENGTTANSIVLVFLIKSLDCTCFNQNIVNSQKSKKPSN